MLSNEQLKDATEKLAHGNLHFQKLTSKHCFKTPSIANIGELSAQRWG